MSEKSSNPEAGANCDYPTPFDGFGRDLIALGTALRQHDTTLEDIVSLSMRCGLVLAFGLVKDKPISTEPAP